DALGTEPLLANAKGGEETMTRKIEGMMCGHCEARVKKTLEAFAEVESAEVSHENGTAVLTLCGTPDKDALRKAVEDDGYQVLAVED
ncbi:MAG: heavy-metal-associated domain-containing protein, partial [Lachnospiraceae bacterium]|nr:heavy-metal-associated domain-containing protein [Lachnospiraceae bacterium]